MTEGRRRGRRVALIAAIGALLVIGAVSLGLGIARLTTNTTVVTAPRVQPTTGTTSLLTRAIENALAHQQDAVAPFKGLTEVRLSVGGKCLRFVVADSPAELTRGLRDRKDLGPYAGMLFVFKGSVDDAFTMSGTKADLDAGFYADNGTRVDRVRMTPCAGSDAECPQYRSRLPYHFALETPTGQFPDGTLAPCTT